MQSTDHEKYAQILAKSNDYQVLRRFERVKKYNTLTNDKDEWKVGLFLDLETTGLDYKQDKIIELAVTPFEFTRDGRIIDVLDSYTSFQDPGIPIPYDTTNLTGITDDMVAGHVIDTEKVKELFASSSIIIAHNAAFDRKFFDKQFTFPDLPPKVWACSQTLIPWLNEGITCCKLEYLAYKFGFFYDAHRAEMDCLAGIHILAQELPISKELALKVLLDNARKGAYRIWACDAPYDLKSILKARGYKWSDGTDQKYKSWYKDVSYDADHEAELEFLRQEVYKVEEVDIAVDKISVFDRFSDKV